MDLPDDIWMHIFTKMWAQKRKDWWDSLNEVDQENTQWGVDSIEMAEWTFMDVFENAPNEMGLRW